jgi:hypothetical protein
VWTGTVAWPHFLACWSFNPTGMAAIKELPVMGKLHVVLGMLTFATLLHSRLITHLLIPRPRLWGFTDAVTGGPGWTKGPAHGALLMYGVSAEDEEKQG